MHKQGIVLITLLLLAILPADGATRKKQLPRWSEHHGEIVLDGICDEFAYGSIDYRDCRGATKRLFEERCSEFRESARHSSGAHRDEHQRQQDKYCSAAARFGAVN